MTIVLPALTVAIAALSVWLIVRIINRRAPGVTWLPVALVVIVGLLSLFLINADEAERYIAGHLLFRSLVLAAAFAWPVVWLARHRQRRGRRFWTVAAVTLLFLYPLSAGPVIGLERLCGRPSLLETAIEGFYAPALWIAELVPFGDLYIDYLNLWIFFVA